MITRPILDDDTIRRLVGDTIYSRGHDYFEGGAVLRMVLRGNLLAAEVAGSEDEAYQVQIVFGEQGLASADCTCPYWDTCKHVAATLLTYLHRPEQLEVRPPLEALLAPLDSQRLRALLLELAADNPGIADAIDTAIGDITSVTTAPQAAPLPARTPSFPTITPEHARRQMQLLLNRDVYDDEGGSLVSSDIELMLAQAEALTTAGDGRAALALLDPISDEFFAHWYEVDEDGELSEMIAPLGEAVAEALLTANLTPGEREDWLQKLTDWADSAVEYGIDNELDLALTAAEQGWDYPPLQRVLGGQIDARGAWDGPPPPYADALAKIRLRVLDRQGRVQEYLWLAEAESQLVEYTTMLARTGHVSAAVEMAEDEFQSGAEALALAEALVALGEIDAALEIAAHGLGLAEPTGALASWTLAQAEQQGQSELALRAATQAFRVQPSLELFLKVRHLVGEGWPALKQQLLDRLKQVDNWVAAGAKVDIYLHEGDVDAAIGAVAHGGGRSLLARVMDAVVNQRPDWVIEQAKKQAAAIMDAGKANYYQDAINWLRRVRDAYRAAGRSAEWEAYLAELHYQHGRKYKLMALLAQLER